MNRTRLSPALAIAWTALLPSGLTAQPEVRGTVEVDGRPVGRAVVQLIPSDGTPAAAAAAPVVMDQSRLRFLPRVLAVPAGSTVRFRNSDPVMHNVFSPRRRGADFDLGTYPTGVSRSHRFDRPGSYLILCHIHPEMAAWVVVAESPLFAVTDDDGAFSIPDVPPGEYTLRAWAPRKRIPERRIVVGADAPTPVPARPRSW